MTKDQILKTIQYKVNGRWVACHDDRGHHYRNTDTGVLVDSVTTKLIVEKPHLVPWAVEKGIEWLEIDDRWSKLKTIERKDYINGARLAFTEVRDDAGFVGHEAHQSIEDYCIHWINTNSKPEDIRSFITSTDPRVFAVARSAELVFNKYNVTPVATEILVGSVQYNCAGTLDMLVLNDSGKLELWDWKSSNHVSDTYAMQVAAYKKFFEQMTGLKISKVKIMHLSKNYDKVDIYVVPNIGDALKAFNHIAKVYDWINNRKKKLDKDVRRIIL